MQKALMLTVFGTSPEASVSLDELLPKVKTAIGESIASLGLAGDYRRLFLKYYAQNVAS